ncbi:VOC family protein [Myxococcus sp. AM009]|uniref:VOC family protein n=1 Tax=unclassified Myxococcus TaxID=2648731 RepID=UPI001595C2AF|nr:MULTISPECIES: VOC family protein [unclassified Myxococcus]NVJ01677.1 VOC family protein [Myxococcus sp. AM009]NVJ13419.1 VOC family protein [Myxococcus sp. AM010]
MTPSVRDVAAARKFHGEALGLKTSESDGMLPPHLAGGVDILVYPKDNHTPASFTILNFPMADIDKAVDALTRRGVRLERYDGFDADAKGIVRGDMGPPIAWFKDPSGNVLAVLETK